MPVILHADDFGIARSATRGILEAWENQALDRFSVMANGRHLEWGCHRLSACSRQPQRLAVHLNLIEGRPLSDPQDSPRLFGPTGRFPFSFLHLLWLERRRADERAELARQIGNEWRKQIGKAQESFPQVKAWSLDSHQHVHVIPWLWEITLKLARTCSINEIRIPVDRLFSHLSPLSPRHWPKPQNLAKVRLIDHLVEQNFFLRLYHPVFVGGLYFSGEMHRLPLSGLWQNLSRRAEEIELLYHPGDATAIEPDDELAFPGFYRHANRQKELQTLLEFRDFARKSGRDK